MATVTAPLPAVDQPIAAAAGSRLLVLRNVGFLMSSQIATWALSLLWNIFVPRVLGPTEIGKWVVGVAVSQMIFMVLGLGVGMVVIKEIAGDRARAPRVVGAAIVMRLGLAPLAFCVVAAYALVMRTSPELTIVVALATAAVLTQLLCGPLLVALQSIERMEYNAYAEVVKAVGLALCIPLVFAGLGLISMMLCLLAAGIAVLGLSWFWYLRHFKIDLRPSFREIRTLAIDGLPYWTTGLVLNFYLWIDSLILSALAPLSAVGWYGVMTRLLGTLLFVPTILSTAYLPRFVRARTEGDEALGAEARPPLELVLVLALPIATGATLVAPKLISDIYGPSFLPAIPVLVLLALCVPPIYLNIMANQVLIAANRQLDWTKVMVGAAIVNPVLNLMLIPYANSRWQNGAVGAAFALLVTEVGMSVVALAMMPRVLNGPSAIRVGKAFVATLLMGAMVFVVRQHFGLMAQVMSGLITFGTLVVVLRVLSHDQALALLTTGRRLRLLRPMLGGGRT